MSANVEKVFHFYDFLLPEVREVVIEEMQPDDRCRFTRCSKSSRTEAKSSKNFIYSLKLVITFRTVSITIGFNEQIANRLFIEQDQRRKIYLICVNNHGRELWREELDSSTDIVQYAAAMFKELLAEYQNRIKSLGFMIDQRLLENYDFGIMNLNNLESLEMDGSVASLQELFSKLRKPLKYLTVTGIENTSFLADCEEIYQVRDKVVLSQTTLNYQQILRLRAKKVEIPFGDITEMDISNFARSWQNGTLGKEVECYQWRSIVSTFDIRRLFLCLGLNFNRNGSAYQLRDHSFKINHNTDAGKRATLRYFYLLPRIIFEVENNSTM